MNTQFYRTRIMIIVIIFSLLSGCRAKIDTKATQQAVYTSGMIAAKIDPETGRVIMMDTSDSLSSIAPDMIAISAVITAQRGAFMLFNDCQHLAIFISPAGQAAGKVQYYLYTFVDTSRNAILSANRMMSELGIDADDIKNLEDLTGQLKTHGFEKLAPASIPTLYATLRLGLAFLRTLGSTISDILVIPAIMLAPDQLYPFCGSGNSCLSIKQ
jgi:hypothetical protein